MKTKQLLIVAFTITAVLQAAVPLKMIYDSEMTERQGIEYKFRTAPIDPTDPFRGKYITLNYDISNMNTKDTTWLSDEKIYVSLGTDAKGFARVADVSRQNPKKGDYILTKVGYYNGQNLNISFPFDRYYMEESKAYDAEIAYRNYSRGDSINYKPTYALVAIRNGNAVLKDVIIDGISIKDYVVKNRK